MTDEIEVKVNASFLLPLSLKRWIEDEARSRKVSTALIVREILDAARAESDRSAELAVAS